MIRIFQCSKLTFQQNRFPIPYGLVQIQGNITYIRCNHFPVCVQSFKQFSRIKCRLVIQMGQQDIFYFTYPCCLFTQQCLLKQLTDLKTNLRILIGIERRNPRFGRSKGLTAQPFFLTLIQQNMIGHDNLCPIRHQNPGGRNPSVRNRLNFLNQNRYIQRHTVSDNTGCMIIKYARRQCMQRKFSIVIYNGMSCVGTALEPHDNVRFLCKRICDLAFSLISPVCSYNCFYHMLQLLSKLIDSRGQCAEVIPFLRSQGRDPLYSFHLPCILYTNLCHK